MTLYSNDNPETTIKNLGFKDEKKAKYSIRVLDKHRREGKIDKKRMMQTVVTLYYRAKHHPYKTKDMESAMKIFSKWIEKNRKK